MTAHAIASSFTKARLYRAVLWLCALVLLAQLTLAVSHQHDTLDEMADCVICHVSGGKAAALPATPPTLLAVFLVIAYLAARRPDYVSVTPRRYLIPPRQAPPAHLPQ